MKNYIIYFFVLLFLLKSFDVKSQDYYWIGFTDKNNSEYSLSNPEQYLSEKAIQRRINQNIDIDSLDLPVNRNYINQVLRSGVTLLHSSKWLNGITVKSDIDSLPQKIGDLPFIKEIQLTKPKLVGKSASNKFDVPVYIKDNEPIDSSYYGNSVFQVGLMNGQFLHNHGYNGHGMVIAVLDGGFFKADIYSSLDSLRINHRILGSKDFVNPQHVFYQTNYHGTSVLSCMGGNLPGELIGTAPGASYWLIRTEDVGSEYIIEEDHWVAGAEFADSVGVDIINSSLGYYTFDDTLTNHTYADLDGRTTRVTQGVNIAFSRGILIFNSAGNEGDKDWKYIIAPSDGEGVIGVGAVNKFGFAASFTSYGPASDGAVKPNVVGVGWNTYLQKSDGKLGYSNGTSYSSPVVAGIAACLWQANPEATASQVKSAIEQSAHLYLNPDSLLGYGIPDMKVASALLGYSYTDTKEVKNNWLVYPNPFYDKTILQNLGSSFLSTIDISIYGMDGRLLMKEQHSNNSKIVLNNLQSLPAGLLILKIDSGDFSESVKLSKSR